MKAYARFLNVLLVLAFVGLGFATSPADAAWYDTNWQFRKSIIIDGTQVIGTQTDFPVLISITDADLAAVARADGFDILFTDDDGAAKLDHEIERYVSATGELVAWVKVPSISAAADKTIYMYYGYPAAADQQNVPGVWSNGYEAVYHLNDDFLDSTINVRNATNNGSIDIVGQVADGQDFTPIDDLRLGSWSVSGSALTMQAWARFDDFNQDDPRVVSKATTSDEQDHVFMLGLGGTGENHLRMRVKTGTSDTSGTTTLVATSSALTVNTWYHVAGTYDGAQMRLLRNGTQVANTPKTGSLRLNGWEIWAGNNPNNTTDTTTYSLDGQLDEIRISSAPRSSAWLTTEYNNQSNPSNFYTLGAQCGVATLPFFDNFNRAASSTVGNCWVETESGAADARIFSNRLVFDTVDDVYAPQVLQLFTQQTSGLIRWRYVFNWDRTSPESAYAVWMQLGHSTAMVDPATSNNTGVAVNLKWGGPNDGMTNHEGFGYVQAASTTEVAVFSGGPGNDHTIDVIANLNANTFDLIIDGITQASCVAFDNNVPIDAVRIYTNAVNQGNFATREFDDVLIETTTLSVPTITKIAFLTDGTPIPTGSTIPSGVEYKYLLYINNQDIARCDVSVRDVLDPAFQYQVGTIQVDNSVAECAVATCTAAEEQAIFAAVDGAAFVSDAVDGDVASYTGASLSVDAGDGNVANLQLDINADAVWAILFSTKMP